MIRGRATSRLNSFKFFKYHFKDETLAVRWQDLCNAIWGGSLSKLTIQIQQRGHNYLLLRRNLFIIVETGT